MTTGAQRGLFRRLLDGRQSHEPIAADQRTAGSDTTGADPLDAAVARGLATGLGARDAPADILRKAERLARSATDLSAERSTVLEALLALVEDYPSAERLQLLAGRQIEHVCLPEIAAAAWAALAQRFPKSSEALRMHLRWTGRTTARADAPRRVLATRFPAFPTAYDELILYARAYDELKMFSEADMAFEAALRLKPNSEGSYLAYVRALQARGNIARAAEVLGRAEANDVLGEQLARFKMTIDLDRHLLGTVSPSAAQSGRVADSVLADLLDRIAERRAAVVHDERSFVGPVFMLNGTLGPGGAERQLMNTAIGLQECIDQGRKLDGRDVIGPIVVCVRSLTMRRDAAFFKPALTKAGVQVVEYSTFEAYGGSRRQSLVRDVADMLHFLPHQMIEGTERLTDIIAGQRPDVVHIWQDGTIFATVLAALLADVPRIVLSVRTAPPIDRPTRMKPEYSVLYPRLVKMPGVVLSANSHYAAQRYAEWLGVDPTRIPVVYNGLRPLPAKGDVATKEVDRTFTASLGSHDFTVGTVMRFDENKRPYAWLDCAAAMLAKAPATRFVMVGDGPLLKTAIEYAELLGIRGRVLFTGHSDQVGYWLKQFDGFLLLSVFEGLPNVLIESQFAGVPVVSTPAGGAAETVIQGQTGLILDNGEDVDPQLVAEKLLILRSNHHQRPAVAALANDWVRRTFSVEQMLESTARVYLR